MIRTFSGTVKAKVGSNEGKVELTLDMQEVVAVKPLNKNDGGTAIIRIFSGSVKTKVGSKIAISIPEGFNKVVGILVASSQKVEVTLDMEGIGAIMQRVEFASKEKDGELSHRGMHPLDYNIVKQRITGVVRSKGGTQTVKIFLKLE